MTDTDLEFVYRANPHAWLLTADNLHTQAIQLRKHLGSSIVKFTDYRNNFSTTRDVTNKSVFLLSGFALENAIKAFLVYENPNWISHGKLARRLKSHSLTSLRQQSNLIPYKGRHMKTLRVFETGLESWARYPCALSVRESEDEIEMQPADWDRYMRLMGAYGARLMALLKGGWHGPHGFYGKWTFSGDYLSATSGGTRFRPNFRSPAQRRPANSNK